MSALTTDPLEAVQAALEAHGHGPRGPVHKFVARCPAHEDRSPSLSVAEGADGRALVYCFSGCETRDIIAAIGLTWSDLFPPGHRHAKRSSVLAPPVAAIDLVLRSLRELDIPYRCTRSPDMWAADRCPACELDPGQASRHALWIGQQYSGDVPAGTNRRVRLTCMHGCSQEAILAALTGATEVVA